ncbi:MAG TPA: tetratricopeptide repeat protein [Tepidisphaeraceae bacterium]|jgi:Flp pilus assembly protein TadD
MSKRRKQPTLPQTATRARSLKPWLFAAILIAATWLVYRPAASGAFLWDDNDYVSDNPALRSSDGLADIWFHPTASPQYYPVVFTTFWVEYALWGDNPHGYHEINILLHALSAILLWRIFRRLRVPGAPFAAAIFAVHPVMVESVAWITERKNTLSLLFYLASLYAYLRFAQSDAPSPAPGTPLEGKGEDLPPPQDPWPWYGASLLLFLFALGSKTVTASLPAAILLIFWWKRRLTTRHAALLLPFFAVGIAAGLFTSHLERAHVGASGPEWNYTLPQRLLIAGHAVWFYVAKLLVPWKLAFVYPKWPVDSHAAWPWLFPIGVVAVIAVLFALRNRIGRGPLVAVLFFVGTLVPALGFVNVYPMRYTFVADHYQYHASIGLIVLFAACLAVLVRREVARTAIASAIVLVLFIVTVVQSGIYKDQETLWTDTLKKNPNSWMVWTNLGHIAERQNPPDRVSAAARYRRALELAPNVAQTHYNVGLVHLNQGDIAGAARELEKAIEIEPRYADAYEMLGVTLMAEKKYDQAIAQFHKTLELEPRHAKARFDLGLALRDQDRLDDAARQFQAVLKLNPNDLAALRELANCRIKQGRFAEAADALGRLVELRPDNADGQFDLGAALLKLGRQEEAQDHLLKAFALKPELRRRLPHP